ncbi:low molecular weight phosphatase family protein [Occultella aeris]|uniref:Arsenate-mycothiol transferase ArsC2 n=1 Tax=Occultella aeris TaxID=2761496 RepID=A0A7M4DJF7_9MICO|nr:hypothetical protein [Occultella aeris]VZO37171.1 Arsenate-mycothiol transferase ArsC2 [Occultella aeris]
MADPDRLRVLALVLTDPRGQTSASTLAGPGMTASAFSAHLEAMARVDLLVTVGQGSGEDTLYRPTHDALMRFGTLALGTPRHGMPSVLAGDHLVLLERIAADLTGTFANVFAPATVARFVTESYELLAARATVRHHLPALTARFVADRLSALVKAQTRPSRHGTDVLFVCVHNAGRSQIAAAVLRAAAGESVRVRTAGSTPSEEVNPLVLEELDRRGLALLTEFPRPLTDEVVRASDVVVTMGCGDACPVVPGRRYLDWPVPDPRVLDPAGIRDLVDEITVRVHQLLKEVGSAS